MDPQQAKFDGWAIVDVLGHQRYIGYVTTEAFGAAVLFRVDVPALEERERVTKRPGYNESQYLPAGSTVKEAAVAGFTKLIGAGSIYTLTPCTREAALEALEQAQHRPLMVVALGPERALPAQVDGAGEVDFDAIDRAVDGDDDEDDGEDYSDGLP